MIMNTKFFCGVGTYPYACNEKAGCDQQVANQWHRLHQHKKRNSNQSTCRARGLWSKAAAEADSDQDDRIFELFKADAVHLMKCS